MLPLLLKYKGDFNCHFRQVKAEVPSEFLIMDFPVILLVHIILIKFLMSYWHACFQLLCLF